MATRTDKPQGQANGIKPDPLADTIAYEQMIAVEAAEIRGAAKALTGELFMRLWPLLRKPIPAGFITTEPATKGKPYPSTGIKSVQVCIDRMDNVLSPLWWWEKVSYEDGGKLCQVTVCVGSTRDDALVVRKSMGGVNQASTQGNLYKGSYTNAAKRAFAMVGVGHEVYLGATDLDPDVSPDAAKAQAERAGDVAEMKLPAERAERLEVIVREAGLADHLPAKLRGFGVKQMTDLTSEQAMGIWEWVQAGQKGAQDG